MLRILILAATLSAASSEPLAGQEKPVEVPRPSAKAMRLYRTGNWLWLAGECWSLALPAALLATGVSARLRDGARALGRKWFLTVGLYVVFYLGLTALLSLPWAYYRGYIRPHEYGLSNQTPMRWLSHWSIAVAVDMLTGFLFAWIPFLLLARSPRRWWLYTGLLFVPFLFFSALIKPTLFDPLFNDFGPMKDKALEARILDLAHRAGIDGSRVFEVDMSRDTKAVNAYVTGFLDTKRIVLWDTTLAKLEPDEVLAIMGHEMGHYVLGHVVQGILLSASLTLLGLFAVDRLGRLVLRRVGPRLGIDSLSDVAALPLLLVLGNLVAFALTPMGFAYSRSMEHEADRFALELTRANHSAGMAFVKLQRENLSNPRPGPLYNIFRATHPSLGDRIDFCNTYHPWHSGRPGRYESLFRAAADGTSMADVQEPVTKGR